MHPISQVGSEHLGFLADPLRADVHPLAAAVGHWLPVLLTFLGAVNVARADARDFAAQGQREFQKGAFSHAVEDWQKALLCFRGKGDLQAEILTSISLAGAYQFIGEQRRAVQILEEARERAEKSGNHSSILLVKSKLGAALTLTLETDRAASLLRESLQTARDDQDSKLAAAILNDLGNLLVTQQKYPE